MKRALVADDDVLVRDLTVELLELCGFVVVATTDGSEALEAFEIDGGFQIVVSDLEMPGLNGIELYDRIRKKNSQIPFILISGNPQKLAQAAIINGATFAKPFPVQMFMDQVNSLVPA